MSVVPSSNSSANTVKACVLINESNYSIVNGDPCASFRYFALRDANISSIISVLSIVLKINFFFLDMSFQHIIESSGTSIVVIET